MKINKFILTHNAHCNECEFYDDGINAKETAYKHARITKHKITIDTIITTIYNEKENELMNIN